MPNRKTIVVTVILSLLFSLLYSFTYKEPLTVHAAGGYFTTSWDGGGTHPVAHVYGLQNQHYVFTFGSYTKNGKVCGHGDYPDGVYGRGLRFVLTNGTHTLWLSANTASAAAVGVPDGNWNGATITGTWQLVNCYGGTATCDSPAKCAACGQYYGNRAGHLWNEGTITKNPTVYDTGIRTFTCQRDGNHTVDMLEPKLQFRVFLGDKRLTLNSRYDMKIYAIYKGNSILIEPTGTAKSPPT